MRRKHAVDLDAPGQPAADPVSIEGAGEAPEQASAGPVRTVERAPDDAGGELWLGRYSDPRYPFEVSVAGRTMEGAMALLDEAVSEHLEASATTATREVSRTSDGSWMGIYRDPPRKIRIETVGETEAEAARALDAQVSGLPAVEPGPSVHELDDPSLVAWCEKYAPQCLNRAKGADGKWTWGEGRKLLRRP